MLIVTYLALNIFFLNWMLLNTSIFITPSQISSSAFMAAHEKCPNEMEMPMEPRLAKSHGLKKVRRI
jgi:hypothetical protein